jgi:chemotaxis protein MotB
MADEAPKSGSGGDVIVIKKKNRGHGHGHHGGAWKVAYADFVTAMMAFFLLLWLLATTSDAQKQGIAHYFNPPNNSTEYGGGAGILGGESAIAVDQHTPQDTVLPPKEQTQEDLAIQVREDAMFRQVSEQITKAMMNIPELKLLMENILVDITPEGLRIQIVDKAGRPLFVDKTAEMQPYTRSMLAVLANVLAQLPNKLAVGGHTDPIPFRGQNPDYTNWELSSDRANAARKVLVDEGVTEKRLAKVTGYAGQELLVIDQPGDPKNNRLSIIVLRAKKAVSAAFSQSGLIDPQAGPSPLFQGSQP